PELGLEADGLWCSFVPAYFPEFGPALASWARCLRPGGWIALTEIDDLFAHEPLEERSRELLESCVREALETGRYDFRMGRRLGEHLERAGLHVTRALKLADQEFSFIGPARPEVLEAWRNRFERLQLLRELSGPDFARLRDDFLACLA